MTDPVVGPGPRPPADGSISRPSKDANLLDTPRSVAAKVILYLTLGVAMLVSIFPFWWMLVASTRSTATILTLPPPIWFGHELVSNFRNLLTMVPLGRDMLNSIIVGVVYTVLAVFFCSLGGYGFAKFRFAGRDKLFAIMLGTLMVPPILGLIPSFMLMKMFGWLDTWYPLIIPSAANAFGIFWMREYISSAVPDEVLDAARVDGASEFRIYVSVVVPVIIPGLSALAIFSFLQKWGDFLWPLLILKDPKNFTLPVAIASMTTKTEANMGSMMLASTVAVLPVLLVFLLASRKFIAGMTLGAVKGG